MAVSRIGRDTRHMRRTDREIKDISEIIKIIKSCDSCSVAFVDGDYPYVIPLNFGVAFLEGKIKLYFHGAKIGKKIDLINNNKKVAFDMSCSHKLIIGENACDYTMEFESVCGRGTMRFLNEEEKLRGLKFLMSQYGGHGKEFDSQHLNAIEVMELQVEEISGKILMKR